VKACVAFAAQLGHIPRMTLGVVRDLVALLATVALAGAACGPKFEETHATPDGPVKCEEQTAASTATENCVRYCSAYVCLGCDQIAEQCKQACLSNVQSATPDPCLPDLLACAVEHVHETVSGLSCADDHSSAFLIAFPEECAIC
jgi:hypothetical protein